MLSALCIYYIDLNTGACVTHLPEVVLLATGNNTTRREKASPDVSSLRVCRYRVITFKVCRIKPVRIQLIHLREEIPRVVVDVGR